jgi:RNA polymerase sigma-70 factor, ECF subfamily
VSTLAHRLPTRLVLVSPPPDARLDVDSLSLVAERELVDRARVDPEAFGELYRLYVDRVHRYAWRRSGNTQVAEDITAATFEAALSNLHRFRWRAEGFAPWLFRVAANQVIAHHRREARPSGDRGQLAMARLHNADVEDDLGHLLDDHGDLRVALAQLNPRYQRAIDLRYLADLSTDEAARAAGLTKPAFSVLLSRALKALRKELQRSDQEGARP